MVKIHRLAAGLVALACVSATGCDPNPNGPSSPPATSGGGSSTTEVEVEKSAPGAPKEKAPAKVESGPSSDR
ncbi:MAG: hypothetical protein SFX72_12065 [Isosphaeraceae bacterium]|nr:hypothetical protein [Isosphaeraceae bacterium]